MLNVEMQTYTYIGSTIVQIYYTILADIVRHSVKVFQTTFPHNLSVAYVAHSMTGVDVNN